MQQPPPPSGRVMEKPKTDWDAALAKHRIGKWADYDPDAVAPEWTNPTPGEREVHVEQSRAALAGATQEQLEAAQDCAEDGDVSGSKWDAHDELAALRAKRLAELRARAKGTEAPTVTHVTAHQWSQEVTTASKDRAVLVLLYKDGQPQSKIMLQRFSELSVKHSSYVKFVKAVGTEAIDNFPDRNCPTLMVYESENPTQNVVGINAFGGEHMTVEDLEWGLSQMGVLRTDLEEDPRIKRSQSYSVSMRSNYVNSSIRGDAHVFADDDADVFG